ncbi:Hsp33 family molecular chaperone [Terrihabitans rhizophilus]|uniref:Hsp33 family molecular chaperone n=1 Tax=Terrihabitans rhizophilus TaxID=3092662 RepID=A0ABU4RLC1_9HYPH|nr:Hsp33 family molecular chaperone [Terrihabitans sp. PJ23]MDX6804450.1 Hsp33 family molecular chaperone [Terrihabitans sp. PJ23]
MISEIPDDNVLPFQVEGLDVRGRVVRLGPTIHAVLARHDYPAPVSKILGEAVALTVLLGTSLKIEGRFQLQTKTDGALDMVVVDFRAPDSMRAYARFDADRVAADAEAGVDLLGKGHLAMTVDPGGDMNRYQGIVPLAGEGLEAAAHEYFQQSEQIPTFVRLAVAEAFEANEEERGLKWRAGGFLVQFLPAAGESVRRDLPPGDVPDGIELPETEEDEGWNEAQILAGTIEDHELIDPMISSEDLLYRLFHERGVRVFETQPVREECTCSRDRILGMLRGFPDEDRRDMVGDDGVITVTCEFCSETYVVTPAEAELEDS